MTTGGNTCLPSVWAQDFWKVFLYTEEDIRARIRYVEENPLKEGKRRQRWSFVTPFDSRDINTDSLVAMWPSFMPATRTICMTATYSSRRPIAWTNTFSRSARRIRTDVRRVTSVVDMTRRMYTARAAHTSAFPTAITLTTWLMAISIIHMGIIVTITVPLPSGANHESGAS